MKQIIRILAGRLPRFSGFLILSSATLLSQPSASNQVVTLEVLELNKIFLSKDFLSLDPVAVLESFAERSAVSGRARLVWTSNGGARKISIASKLASPSCLVRVDLTAVQGSTAAKNRLELDDASTQDFIHGLSKSAGSCEVVFLVVTNDPEWVRPHIHAVVYTVTSS